MQQKQYGLQSIEYLIIGPLQIEVAILYSKVTFSRRGFSVKDDLLGGSSASIFGSYISQVRLSGAAVTSGLPISATERNKDVFGSHCLFTAVRCSSDPCHL